MKRKIVFVCKAVRWLDQINGNTYHSVRITRKSDGEVIGHQLTYGYGDHYKHTALETMAAAKWENNYPIQWDVSDGQKRDVIDNGEV